MIFHLNEFRQQALFYIQPDIQTICHPLILNEHPEFVLFLVSFWSSNMANVYARSRKGATPFFRDERDNDRWAGVNISLPDFMLNISSVVRWE